MSGLSCFFVFVSPLAPDDSTSEVEAVLRALASFAESVLGSVPALAIGGCVAGGAAMVLARTLSSKQPRAGIIALVLGVLALLLYRELDEYFEAAAAVFELL